MEPNTSTAGTPSKRKRWLVTGLVVIAAALVTIGLIDRHAANSTDTTIRAKAHLEPRAAPNP